MARPTDSETSVRMRAQKIAMEAEEQRQQKLAAETRRQEREDVSSVEARQREDEFIDKISKLSRPETREDLLQRIREMRMEKPEPLKPQALTETMRKQIEAEQAAGRAALEKARQQDEAVRQMREETAKEEVARQGEMAPVHHPNPTMDEKFPVNKATIK